MGLDGRKPIVSIRQQMRNILFGEGAERLPFAPRLDLWYAARRWTELGRGYSSPGLTDESIVLFLAEGLEKKQPGGGDEGEDITVHEVAMDNVVDWLREQEAHADLKLLAGLFAAQTHLKHRGRHDA